MTQTKVALSAYGKAADASLTGRQIEGLAFLKAASLLESAIKTPDDKKLIGEAVHTNNKLWSIIMKSVSENDSPLPLQLRQNLMTIGIFSTKQTNEALATGKYELFNSIIENNRHIAAGLMAHVEEVSAS